MAAAFLDYVATDCATVVPPLRCLRFPCSLPKVAPGLRPPRTYSSLGLLLQAYRYLIRRCKLGRGHVCI